MHKEWNKENWGRSVTSRAWASTPYDAGWEESKRYGEDLSSSTELEAIFEEEMALGKVPCWATETVERMIGPLPSCGHYAFPQPILQICQAIGEEKCPDFVCGCYTCDSERKKSMSYYVYCLDAWLKGAPLETATAELLMRDDLGKDWSQIITAIYETLGTPTDRKKLLIERLIHRQRWWIKTLIWHDDRRDRHMLDAFLGDARGDEARWSAYGNSPFGDPYFAERELPEMKRLARQIREAAPKGKGILERIESTWLCAPKAFRYLEKLIVEIGGVGSESPADGDAMILQCEDTYPDVASYRKWYAAFMSSLSEWLKGNAEALPQLDELTPTKHWLVGILRHKLRLYEKRHTSFGLLIGARPSGRRGTKRIE